MIINGRKIAKQIRGELRERVEKLGKTPRMDIVSLSRDRAIQSFVRRKKKFGEKIGVDVIVHDLAEDIAEDKLIPKIDGILRETDGIVIQLPLPPQIDTDKILERIPTEKDIDVLNPESIRQFADGQNKSTPPVPGAIDEIIKILPENIKDKKIVIAGFGKLVGQPVGMAFDRDGISYDVIDKNTSPEDKEKLLRNADIIISGTGQSHSIKSEDIKEGVVLVDAGTSELAKKMVGDIDPGCYEKASFYTPVPGGVGPITIAILFRNLVNSLTS